MGEVRPGAAPARGLMQALAVIVPLLAAGSAAANHCRTVLCRHDGDFTGGADNRTTRVPVPVERAFGLEAWNHNNFAGGYLEADHVYDGEWIKENVTEPQARPVRASACDISLTTIRLYPLDDEPGCGTVQVREAPADVRTIRWSLLGQSTLTNQEVVLDTEPHPLGRLQPEPGSACVPARRPYIITDQDCAFRTSAPIPTDFRTDTLAEVTVRMEMLNGRDDILYFASETVPIPAYAPLIASVGDSMASGEGNPDEVGVEDGDSCHRETTWRYKRRESDPPDMLEPAQWFDDRDHRSLRSAPALAARDLLEEWPYVHFLSFAKSGSATREPGRPNEDSVDVREQLEDLYNTVGDRRIDALLITVGANDAGFSDIVSGLADGTTSHGVAVRRFLQNILRLRGEVSSDDGYPAVQAQIENLGLNVSNVIITEYPGSLFNDREDRPVAGCGLFEFGPGSANAYEISSSEALSIHHMGRFLNEEVELAAEQLGWHLVDGIDERFRSHGYCSGQSFYVFAEDTCSRQGDFEGILHPNGPGTRVIAEETARMLREVLPAPPGRSGDPEPFSVLLHLPLDP